MTGSEVVTKRNYRGLWPVLRILFSLLLIMGLPSQILAVSTDNLNAVLNDTTFYDPSGGLSTCGTATDASLTGSDNAQKAFTFFLSKGLTADQVAGLMGNLYEESSINPMSSYPGSTSPTPISGDAFGLAQWLGSRVDNLGTLAQQENLPIDDLGLQLDFIWDELNGTPPASSYATVLAALKATTTVQDATNVILLQYEAPVTQTDPTYPAVLAQRTGAANSELALYGGDAATVTASTPTASSGDGCGTTVGGVACTGNSPLSNGTECINGFTLYLQFEGPWATNNYGDGNIAANGCGPTSMAMIITTLTGQQVTPDQTAAYALSDNQYVNGNGSEHTIGPALAKKWGLTASPIGADASKISAALQAGSLVIAEGQGAEPFTSGGHFIVIRALAPDGKWLVGDPGHNDSLSMQEWDPTTLISEMSSDSVYAISK